MKNAFLRDILKEIIKSINRYLAIVLIVSLGVGFLYGITVTSPAMKYTADSYFDRQRLMDIRLASSVGFTREDADELSRQSGVQAVYPTYTLDMLIDTPEGTKSVRVHALPGEDGLDRPALVAGRWPQQPNECVVDSKQAEAVGGIGAVLVISSKNGEDKLELLENKSYTITGLVESPEYINFANRGTISIGDGSIFCFVYIPPGNFSLDYYTDLLVEVDGARALLCYSDAYDSLVEGAAGSLKAFSKGREQVRYSQIVTEANTKVGDAERELADKRAEAEQKIEDAQADIDQADRDMADAQKKLDDGDKAIQDAKAELAKQKKQTASDFADAQKLIDKAAATIAAKQKQVDAAEAALAGGQAQYETLLGQIQALKDAGRAEEAAVLQAQADALGSELAAQTAALAEAKAQIKSAKDKLAKQKSTLSSARKKAEGEFEKAQKEIDKNEAELGDARSELSKSQSELADAKKTFGDTKADTEESISEAQGKIDDAKKKVSQIEQPQWVVLTRQDTFDFSSFGSDANRISALSSVFPVFFYLIAALVCLTTMTRMVEEQRTQMGVLRALGYSRGAVSAKFLFYAISASLLGCTAGLLAGQTVLPNLIYGSYQSTYTLPALSIPFDTGFALAASLTAVVVNALAALWAFYREIASVPADLIRPRAPAAGRRVLLERLPALWRRLSFLRKITIRNLFRFKKRFFMTVLGIAGCTALLLAGFGLRDSVTGTVPKQYYGLHSYHLYANLVDAGSAADASELNEALSGLLDDWLYVTQDKVNVTGLDRTTTTYLFVGEDPQKTAAFINFHNRETRKPIAFPQPGRVILTDKIARILGVGEGGMVTFSREDSAPVTMTVGGVTENYVYNYIYMTPEDYNKAFGSAPKYKMLLGKARGGESISQAQEAELTTALLKQSNVLSATAIASLKRQFNDAMKNLDAVVMIIILCACMLNFIVLYNLTNINITERTREIATIKVLGFFNREVSSYINREIVALTLIGILAGLVGGWFLHLFTIQTAEVGIMMYVREINFVSYVWAVVLTMLFTAVINIAIQFRLRRIKMVESLKSVE